MAAGAAMLANTMTAAPVSTILFSVCLNIFDPLSSRISVVTHVTCEANIAVAGTRGDQPMGWLSTVERMRFCINRSVESMDANRYKKHHHLVQKLTPSSELGSYRYRIHRISEKRCSRKPVYGRTNFYSLGPGAIGDVGQEGSAVRVPKL